MTYLPLAQTETREFHWMRDLLACLLGSILISLFAQLAIPLPFTPVPISMQTFGVLLVTVLQGRKAFFSVFGYLAQGCLGFPVFAGGAAGMAVLLGPTGGYCIGFLAASYVAGRIADRNGRRTLLTALYSMTVATFIIYGFGLMGLSPFMGFKKSLLLGVLPFILGDLFKILLALRALKALRWVRD